MPRLTITNILGTALAVANSNTGFAKGFTIPAAGLVKDLTGGELEELAPQLDAHRTAGRISWVTAQNPNVSDELETLAGVGRAAVLPTVAHAAKSTTGVHASYLGTAANAFPGPFTNPASPRNVSVVAAATYDGGSITVTGTDQFDRAQTEVIVTVANSTVYGVKIFKTITAASKATVGVAAVGASLGTGDKIGSPYKLQGTDGIMFAGATAALRISETVTVDPTYSGWTATSVPNGTILFTPILNTVG